MSPYAAFARAGRELLRRFESCICCRPLGQNSSSRKIFALPPAAEMLATREPFPDWQRPACAAFVASAAACGTGGTVRAARLLLSRFRLSAGRVPAPMARSPHPSQNFSPPASMSSCLSSSCSRRRAGPGLTPQFCSPLRLIQPQTLEALAELAVRDPVAFSPAARSALHAFIPLLPHERSDLSEADAAVQENLSVGPPASRAAVARAVAAFAVSLKHPSLAPAAHAAAGEDGARRRAAVSKGDEELLWGAFDAFRTIGITDSDAGVRRATYEARQIPTQY